MENKAMNFTSIFDVKRNHKGHWFSPDTMRFFQSRVSEQVYQGMNKVYFVSSERNGYHSPRRFTVRVFDCETKSIDTVGEFNQLSRYQAHKMAANIAASETNIF